LGEGGWEGMPSSEQITLPITATIDLDQDRKGSDRDAQFKIKVDGVVRSHRDVRDTAIEAARFLQQRNPNAKVTITDVRDGSSVSWQAS